MSGALLVAESLDGIEARSVVGGVYAEEEPDDNRDAKGNHDRKGRDGCLEVPPEDMLSIGQTGCQHPHEYAR